MVMMVMMLMCICVSANVEVRRHSTKMLLSFSWELPGLNWGRQACKASTFTSWALVLTLALVLFSWNPRTLWELTVLFCGKRTLTWVFPRPLSILFYYLFISSFLYCWRSNPGSHTCRASSQSFQSTVSEFHGFAQGAFMAAVLLPGNVFEDNLAIEALGGSSGCWERSSEFGSLESCSVLFLRQ